MAISDYLKKHAQRAQEDGLRPAAYNATSEALLKAGSPIARRYATPIWDEDWDICLVLDACRFDLWREVSTDYDWLETGTPKWSVGSASPEWLSHTFSDEHRDEIRRAGYVTANPFSGKSGDELRALDESVFPLSSQPLEHLDEVWRDEWPADQDLPTVDPETLTERAFWAWETQDIDRLVVHYMQPHIPFRSRPEWCGGWDLDRFGTGGGYSDKDDWKRVRDGEIDPFEFWRAYRDNLEWVLEEVNRWYRRTDNRILVTSDHGNAMGELGEWSHPPRSANPVLRRVPWVTVDGVSKGGRVPDSAMQAPGESTDDGQIEQQLEALGYK